MVIGNGLIGSKFRNSKNVSSKVLIFASGVSDSNANVSKDFKREKDLILDSMSKYNDLTFVYFSSILSGVSNNHYYTHKFEMENLIKSKTKNYLIFKVPQIIGFNGNNNNLIKHLSNAIKNGDNINLFKGINRALVDVDDIVNIVNYCVENVKYGTINLSHIEKLNISEIALEVIKTLGVKPNVNIIENNNIVNWDTPNSKIIDKAIIDLGIDKNNYTNKIIKKYIN
jgi:nucleoside-diphosphate-sugar epimerase